MGVLKAVVARFDAAELITQREIVSQTVSEELADRAKQFGIILDDISITHLTFGKEFTEAVELKQVAQQDAERAKYIVDKAEQTKKATIISSEGDTKAAELLAKDWWSCEKSKPQKKSPPTSANPETSFTYHLDNKPSCLYPNDEKMDGCRKNE